MGASIEGHTETVAMLWEKGADVNAKDKDAMTAFHWASNNGHTEIVSNVVVFLFSFFTVSRLLYTQPTFK